MKIKKLLNKILAIFCLFVIVSIISFFSIKFGKAVSYKVFYEDYVIETIKENVKSESLK